MSTPQRPLRVLHVASGDLWGGAEAQTAALCKALRDFPQLELKAVVLNDGQLCERLCAAGIPTQVLSEQSRSPSAILWRLARLVRGWPADIVHTHRQKENILGALAARFGRAVSLRTVHGGNETGDRAASYRTRLARFADAWVARHLQARCVAVSTELRARLERELPGAALTVIENGLDARAVRARARGVGDLSIPAGKRTLAFVGRLVPVKRVDRILEALAVLKALRGSDFICLIVGEGPLRAELEGLARALAVEDVCRFLGFRSDVEHCIAAAEVLVLASEHEGLPMTVLEALALGTTVVATPVGGVPDVLAVLGGGYVAAAQPAELADTLNLALHRHQARSPLASLGAYDIHVTAERYLHLYQLLVTRK